MKLDFQPASLDCQNEFCLICFLHLLDVKIIQLKTPQKQQPLT